MSPSIPVATPPLLISNGEETGGKRTSRRQRRQQTGTFFTDLNFHIHIKIFKALSPTGRRLMAATCKRFFKIYKTYYWREELRVTDHEVFSRIQTMEFIGDPKYKKMMALWLIPKPMLVADRASNWYAKFAWLSQVLEKYTYTSEAEREHIQI